jgi:hypothetical protein
MQENDSIIIYLFKKSTVENGWVSVDFCHRKSTGREGDQDAVLDPRKK